MAAVFVITAIISTQDFVSTAYQNVLLARMDQLVLLVVEAILFKVAVRIVNTLFKLIQRSILIQIVVYRADLSFIWLLLEEFVFVKQDIKI